MVESMTTDPLAGAFNALLAQLPLHAEESQLRESLPTSVLVSSICDNGISADAAQLAIDLLRRQFESLSLLDRAELAAGRWAFVSFPAALAGHALVATWATPTQTILPLDYWEQGDHRPAAVREEQRAILHRIESERLRHNPNARPVRTVHVAWAVIRIGDKFLLHRREDRDRPGEKSHVLPGGRLNPSDLLPAELKEGSTVLRKLFDPTSPLADASLDATLVRELDEELNLRPDEDYSFSRWQRLPPYRALAGTGNRHAYTEYAFQLYTLKLTLSGETRLLEKEEESGALVWFTMDELSAPRRADGSSAFVDALHSAWGDKIASELAAVPESGASALAMQAETQMLDLPASPETPWLLGKPGKERPLNIVLDQSEWQLLLLLGWHARGFPVDADQSIRRLGGGWIRFEHEVVKSIGSSLRRKTAHDIPLVEMRDGCYLRVSITPEILMFAPALFGYAIEEVGHGGGRLVVVRSPVSTPWGVLGGARLEQQMNRNTLRILRALECHEDPVGRMDLLAGDWERNLRQQMTAGLRNLGLRKLWTTESKVSSLVAGIIRLTTHRDLP